jgi:hypothetical protein
MYINLVVLVGAVDDGDKIDMKAKLPCIWGMKLERPVDIWKFV